MNPRIAVVALGAFAVAACQPPAETPEQTQARIESESAAAKAAIDSLARAFAEHFSLGHAEVVAGFYAENGVLMPPNGPAATGRAAIQEVFASFIPTQSPRLTLTTQSVVANGPIAVERGTYTLSLTPPGATQPINDSGKYLVHWHLVDGRWMMVEDIWNSDLPLPPAP